MILCSRHKKDNMIYAAFALMILKSNRIGGVMVSVLASRAVDRGFESRSGQTKDYAIDIC